MLPGTTAHPASAHSVTVVLFAAAAGGGGVVCSEREKLMGMSAISFLVVFVLTRWVCCSLGMDNRAGQSGAVALPTAQHGLCGCRTCWQGWLASMQQAALSVWCARHCVS